jgi:hypothetical protein
MLGALEQVWAELEPAAAGGADAGLCDDGSCAVPER